MEAQARQRAVRLEARAVAHRVEHQAERREWARVGAPEAHPEELADFQAEVAGCRNVSR